MEWSQVRALVGQGRGKRLELLAERSAPRRIAEALAALANAEGGHVLIGGALQGQELTGLQDPQATLDRAMDAILLCQPPLIVPLPELVTNNDSSECLVLLQVPEGLPNVYAVEGRYLVRDDTAGGNRPLAPQELKRLLIQRGRLSYEAQEADGATADDLDWERVRRYGERVGLLPGFTLEQVLQRRGCWAGGANCPTIAGVLLFGRLPERFVRSSEIIAVRYAGPRMSDRFVREDIRGPLPDQIQRAEAFVLSNMRRGTRLEGLERIEQLEYPEQAVREAIVNAVAHRDYSVSGEGIRLLMFSDRLEIYSPGRLPGHVTLENILEERYSRNEIIVQVLADMGYIERLGYGMDRMFALLDADGLPSPDLQETANGFQVTLYGHRELLDVDADDDGREQDGRRRDWQRSGLNPRQRLVLAYLDDHEQITNREYQTLCPDVSPETLRRDLAELVRQGLLLKIGSKRATYYVLR
ncbi:MAG: DeoR family transcriptional regulator [Chloroflexi bacterium]|jgi:ATP-dependent DNA helicase RecG|nr:DeoR family transcriptional regulator [Chloroflexota bacterium]